MKNFINFKGYLRYCIVIMLLDGSIVLIGGCFWYGKMWGLFGFKKFLIVLKGCEDI